MSDTASLLPTHVGYIIDGNRRWAKKHGLPPYEGHLAGYNALKQVLIDTVEMGVPYMSAYVFSTENWKRSGDEVKRLLTLVLKLLTSDLPEFHKHGIRLKVVGSREGLEAKIIKAIENAERETAGNTAGEFLLCFNYGGQLEITEAVQKIVELGTPASEITQELIGQYIYAPEVPPVDLIVRTGGEERISNFMLWRAAYSEFLFIEKSWPDMTKDDVTFIMNEYAKRQRRFGS